MVFGSKQLINEEFDENYLRQGLSVVFSFLVSMVNLKLLISIIGETFAKQQISRVALIYQMKASYLLEYAECVYDIKKCCGSKATEDELEAERAEGKYFHFIYYEDS